MESWSTLAKSTFSVKKQTFSILHTLKTLTCRAVASLELAAGKHYHLGKWLLSKMHL